MHGQQNIRDWQLLANVSRVTHRLYLQGANNPRRLMRHNRSVFTTEMKNVYSAVRTGSLNKAVCASSLKGYSLKMGPVGCPETFDK